MSTQIMQGVSLILIVLRGKFLVKKFPNFLDIYYCLNQIKQKQFFETPCIRGLNFVVLFNFINFSLLFYFRRFAPRCSGCGEVFHPTDLVRKARELYFHVMCFMCGVCGRQLHTGDQVPFLFVSFF
jgi:hypothetical protein